MLRSKRDLVLTVHYRGEEQPRDVMIGQALQGDEAVSIRAVDLEFDKTIDHIVAEAHDVLGSIASTLASIGKWIAALAQWSFRSSEEDVPRPAPPPPGPPHGPVSAIDLRRASKLISAA
jgi:hypothetical protein